MPLPSLPVPLPLPPLLPVGPGEREAAKGLVVEWEFVRWWSLSEFVSGRNV